MCKRFSQLYNSIFDTITSLLHNIFLYIWRFETCNSPNTRFCAAKLHQLAHNQALRSLSLKHLVFGSLSKHKRVVGSRVSVERLTSGAVIADACCNLSILSLFTSLFSFFLNYLKCYLSKTETWKNKKKSNLLFLCIMAYVKFLRRKMFCVLSFRGVKKSLLSVKEKKKNFENIQKKSDFCCCCCCFS